MASSVIAPFSVATWVGNSVALPSSSSHRASNVKLGVRANATAQLAVKSAQTVAGLEVSWFGSRPARLGASALPKRLNYRLAAVASAQWRLKQKSGDAEITLTPGSAICIGRREDNNFVIDVSTVSGRHAGLEVDDNGNAFITDLQSTNGTMIIRPDGINRPLAPMDRTQLADGTDIIFADPDDASCVFVATAELVADEVASPEDDEGTPASA